MRIETLALSIVLLWTGLPWSQSQHPEDTTSPNLPEERNQQMHVKKITPVLFVEDVEPCVKFWVSRFGFEKTAEVPDGDHLAFVMLQKGNVELMYQSYASADKDVAAISQVVRKGPTFLYVEVDNLEETINAVKGAELVMPKRKTFYGSTEIGIRDPAGHFVTFAEFAASTQH
ncbi:MAG: VOC family protein [Acidobacteriia bacterium]|nr:VOC family protein [Terriglobia bacterium]